MSALAPSLQAFFTDRLMRQRDASPHTIAGYRDTFRLLLNFAAERVNKRPSALDIGDVDAPLVAAFLHHLEQDRHSSVRTRNHRLAAIHSLFAYLALRHPEHAATVQRVLAIPAKRVERNLVTFLSADEVAAILAACDVTTWTGRRDHAMFLLMIQTGLRISEVIGLSCADVALRTGPHVHCVGKGRKERQTPLLPGTVRALRNWLAERSVIASAPLFPTVTGRPLSPDAVEHRLALYRARAATACPSLQRKHVTPHTLRHTAAMRLLVAEVDVAVIALWLGHEQVGTTSMYLHADLSQKQRAIARTTPIGGKQGRYRPPDPVLRFLDSL